MKQRLCLPYEKEYTIVESLRAPKQDLNFLLSLFTLNAAEKLRRR
jgi:hypothetical protein